MTQINLSTKQKQTHRQKADSCLPKGRQGTESVGSLGLADASYYIQDR